MSTPQFIYTMYKVDKFHGPEKHILKEVSLSFIPGAKIGVLARTLFARLRGLRHRGHP